MSGTSLPKLSWNSSTKGIRSVEANIKPIVGGTCWILLGCPLFLNDIWSPDFVPALRRFLNVAIKSSMIFPEHLVCCYKSGFNVNLQNTQHHDWFGDVSSRERKIKMSKGCPCNVVQAVLPQLFGQATATQQGIENKRCLKPSTRFGSTYLDLEDPHRNSYVRFSKRI